MRRAAGIVWMMTAVLFANSHFKDSDMDGVSDQRDKCRNTPFFALVDSRGCTVKRLAVRKR